ncbi:MAG TPA: hypothetical protein PKN50_08255 [Spirochaetota bacterium]|nr:hypothetical protein [Spirochaetota bacterium]HPV42490.1 hypothetical protein [Spirochaetota bacterium]
MPRKNPEGNPPARPLSIASRLWIAANTITPPFANQVIVEGAGRFNADEWRRAVRIASDANPGTRLVLKGRLGSSRWVDSGVTPPVREVDGSSWDGMGSEGAPFLKKDFDPRKGPCSEVLLMHGDPARAAFRSHHAIMDGRGAMTWTEDIFRVLRGEEPLGSEYIMVENDLLNLTRGKRSRPLPHQYIAPTGMADGTAIDLVWKRATLFGKYPRLLARVLLLTAREAWRHGDGRVRIGIPVDLRSRREGLRSTSNLANAIYIDIDRDASAESIAGEIARRLSLRADGEITWEDLIISYVPIRLLARAIRSEGARNQKSGQFRFSGFVSNLGRVESAAYSCGSFTATSYIGIPVCAPILPFSMTLSGLGDRIELLLMMPRNMSTGGRLEAVLDSIAAGLGKSD